MPKAVSASAPPERASAPVRTATAVSVPSPVVAPPHVPDGAAAMESFTFSVHIKTDDYENLALAVVVKAVDGGAATDYAKRTLSLAFRSLLTDPYPQGLSPKAGPMAKFFFNGGYCPEVVDRVEEMVTDTEVGE